MSTGEHHALIDVLRQNPELLKEVENDQPNACGRTDTVRDEESDARLGSTAEAPDINDWPEPAPLGGELPVVQAFDLALLPESLRPLVEDTAERMQVPVD